MRVVATGEKLLWMDLESEAKGRDAGYDITRHSETVIKFALDVADWSPLKVGRQRRERFSGEE
jgi:hypothetical protein